MEGVVARTATRLLSASVSPAYAALPMLLTLLVVGQAFFVR
jgi:hypothetical protein